MSVQVRRRRESAAFLATFTGAQGELLVDTTNNRVQVHDGATPGGWPVSRIVDLSCKNALINGNFMINQRAYASSTALAVGVYAHDRWRAGANGCTYFFAQTPNDTTINITAGSLIQSIEGANICETSYVLSWTGTAVARAYQGSAGSYSAGTTTSTGVDGTKNYLVVSGLSIGTSMLVEFSAGTVGTIQLEPLLPNAGPTNFERRQKGLEMLLCQRYYQILGGNNIAEVFGVGGCYATNFVFAQVVLLIPMRATPTVTFSAASTFQIVCNGSITAASSVAVNTVTLNSLGINFTPSTSVTVGTAAVFRAASTSAQIALSAEL